MSATLSTDWLSQFKARIKCEGQDGVGKSTEEVLTGISLLMYEYFACQEGSGFTDRADNYNENLTSKYERIKCEGPFNSADQARFFIAEILDAAVDTCND